VSSSRKTDIGVVIMAAGESGRLGRVKQLLPFRGKPLLQHTVDAVGALNIPASAIVLGAHAEAILSNIDFNGFDTVINEDWESGMAGSMQMGLKHLLADHPHLKGVLLLVADQPFISTDLLEQMMDAFHQGNDLVACRYNDVVGVPALIGQRYFSELQQTKGDKGARQLLHSHAEEIYTIDFPEGAIDIDTWADYEQWQKSRPGYECPNCGRQYSVRPKACECEKVLFSFETGETWYVGHIRNEEAIYELRNDMLPVSDVEGVDLKEIAVGDQWIEKLDLMESADPSIGKFLVAESFERGVETVDTYHQTYFPISNDLFQWLMEWEPREWEASVELINKKNGLLRFQLGNEYDPSMYEKSRTIDHDHCLECMDPISDQPDHQNHGYYHPDHGWMCRKCFNRQVIIRLK